MAGALTRWKPNFESNERIDKPDFEDSFFQAWEQTDLLLRLLTSDVAAGLSVKRYQQGTHSGLTFKIKLDVSRGFMDSDQNWIYVNPSASGVTQDLTLQNNTTNYVWARILATKDNPQSRAFWDTDLGVTGEEFFDTINVRYRLDETFVVTQSTLQPSIPTDELEGSSVTWLRIFDVVTSGGAISTVTQSDDFLWKPRSYSLPVASSRATAYTDGTLRDLRSYIDFSAALLAEIKGTSETFEAAPWGTLRNLRESTNGFFVPQGRMRWDPNDTGGRLYWDGTILFRIPGRATDTTVAASGSPLSIADGDVVFLTVPDAGGSATFVTAAYGTASQLVPGGANFNQRTIAVFARVGSRLYDLRTGKPFWNNFGNRYARVVTSDTVLSENDSIVLANATGGPINLTLPTGLSPGSILDGWECLVGKLQTDVSANLVTIVGTVGGEVNPTINYQGNTLKIVRVGGVYYFG